MDMTCFSRSNSTMTSGSKPLTSNSLTILLCHLIILLFFMFQLLWVFLNCYTGNQPHLWNRTSLQCLQEFEKQRIEIQNECERKESGKLRLQHQQQPTPKSLSAQSLFSPVKTTTVDSTNQSIVKKLLFYFIYISGELLATRPSLWNLQHIYEINKDGFPLRL